ncbi:hypothetical protein ACOMHN_055798 [Nucella lapillus]
MQVYMSSIPFTKTCRSVPPCCGSGWPEAVGPTLSSVPVMLDREWPRIPALSFTGNCGPYLRYPSRGIVGHTCAILHGGFWAIPALSFTGDSGPGLDSTSPQASSSMT